MMAQCQQAIDKTSVIASTRMFRTAPCRPVNVGLAGSGDLRRVRRTPRLKDRGACAGPRAETFRFCAVRLETHSMRNRGDLALWPHHLRATSRPQRQSLFGGCRTWSSRRTKSVRTLLSASTPSALASEACASGCFWQPGNRRQDSNP